MKYLLNIIFPLLINFSNAQQKELLNSNSFTCVVRESKFDYAMWAKSKDLWRQTERDTVIFTKYMKGSACDLPLPGKMSATIVNDTLFFDFGRIYDPECERRIGVAGIFIDFVVNKRKYPNYRKLIVENIYDNPNWKK